MIPYLTPTLAQLCEACAYLDLLQAREQAALVMDRQCA